MTALGAAAANLRPRLRRKSLSLCFPKRIVAKTVGADPRDGPEPHAEMLLRGQNIHRGTTASAYTTSIYGY